MLRVIGCLTDSHNPMLVATAVALCALSAVAALSLLARARAARGRRAPLGWLGLAAVAFGGGVWATHFVAILAYDPGLPVAYDLWITLASATLLVAAAAANLGLCLTRPTPPWAAVGGAGLGLGVGVMHYLGMAALHLPGRVEFDAALVIASVAAGATLSAAAMARWARPGWPAQLRAAGMLTAGVVALHFTGMDAMEILPDGLVPMPIAALDRDWLAALVAGVTAAGLLAAAGIAVLEARVRAAASGAEAARMRGLADATFEGIAVLAADGTIHDANRRLTELLDRPLEAVLGAPLSGLLHPAPGARPGTVEGLLALAREEAVTTALVAADGLVPVEVRAGIMETADGACPVLAVRDLRERLAAEARIAHMALHDALTGLPNRRRFQDALAEVLARAARNGGSTALLMVDLDRFKPVNDLHGHHAGDQLLQQVADRLRGVARETDTVARLGGDEFALVADLGGVPEDAARIARRVVAALETPFDLDGVTAQVGTSVGVAVAPQDGSDAELLRRRADVALYRAKAEGRGCFRFFEPGMDTRIRERAELEAELRLAIARDELVPHFQPLVGLDTGHLMGFEMLARWPHPVRGEVLPDRFVPIAEDAGLAGVMTERLLRRACRAAAIWPDHLALAANLSPVQLRDRTLPGMIRAVLAETGLPARRLEVELMESALIEDFELAREILLELKATGVRLALDDFGTGYSSLKHLQALPLDKLKIDAGFIRSMAAGSAESRKIVAAVVSLGHSLGLPTVAEGVEDTDIAAVLRTLGCNVGQGWLFGRAVPAEAVDTLLAQTVAGSAKPAPPAALGVAA